MEMICQTGQTYIPSHLYEFNIFAVLYGYPSQFYYVGHN